MSTVSRYVTSSRLTPRALNVAIVPFISLLFLSGFPRVTDPLILTFWNVLFPTQMPTYLLSISAIFGYLSVLSGLVKYFASEDLAEELRIEGDIKTFGPEDVPLLLAYLTAGYGGLLLFGIDLTPVTVVQTGTILLLSLSYVTIPWYLWMFAELPQETEDLVVKSFVFSVALVLAGVMTVGALVVVRAAGVFL